MPKGPTDDERAEKLWAIAGKLLDKSSLDNDARALEVARKVAALARHVTMKPEGWRAYADLFIAAADPEDALKGIPC